MDRLTKLDEYGDYVCNVNYVTCAVENCACCRHFDDIVNKLWEYENSGLDPKTVQKIAEFMKLFPQLSEKYLKGE